MPTRHRHRSSHSADEEEFVKFIQTKITRSSQSHAIPEAVDHMVPGAIYDHLSNFGAQHGYVAAHAILKKRPEAARDKFASKERYRGYVVLVMICVVCVNLHGLVWCDRVLKIVSWMLCRNPGVLFTLTNVDRSDWYPLHYILAQDVSGSSGDSRAAAAKARRLVAVPIVQALIKAYPAAAAQRCMEGVRFPKGHLPLELAIAKGWGLEVVEPLYKAYPEAATGLEPCNDKALKRLEDRDLLTTLKGYRWMRQIAEKVGADDAIVSMLPKPTLVDGRVSWISGEEVAEIEEEKARLKAQRIAKKKAKKEAKRAKESEKQKQLENEIKLQRLLNRHSQSSADDVSVGASSVPSVLTFADQ